MYTISEIADALTAWINAQAWPLSITAKRAYRPVLDLVEMPASLAGGIHCFVVPRALETLPDHRGGFQTDYLIDVAVQAKVSNHETVTLDPLMGLVKEIVENVRNLVIQTPACVCVTAIRNEPIYSPDHLDDLNQFTSVLTVTLHTVEGG